MERNTYTLNRLAGVQNIYSIPTILFDVYIILYVRVRVCTITFDRVLRRELKWQKENEIELIKNTKPTLVNDSKECAGGGIGKENTSRSSLDLNVNNDNPWNRFRDSREETRTQRVLIGLLLVCVTSR